MSKPKVRDDPYPTKTNPNLLQVALRVHMSTFGSYETTIEEQHANLAFLRKRVREWVPTAYLPSKPFDDACKALFVTVLDDVKKMRKAKQ